MSDQVHKPILFQGEMVRAILSGSKTQTRRIVKGSPNEVRWNTIVVNGYGGWTDEHGRPTPAPCKIGDILYVRESWYDHGQWLELDSIPEKPRKWAWESDLHLFTNPTPKFAADFVGKDGVEKEIVTYTAGPHYRKMSSLHLPKKHSRIFLKVVDVRVERLQDISPADAIAEGIRSEEFIDEETGDVTTLYCHYLKNKWGPDPIHSYQTLWEKINGNGSWETPQWVWVIEFEQLKDFKNPFQ